MAEIDFHIQLKDYFCGTSGLYVIYFKNYQCLSDFHRQIFLYAHVRAADKT
jgi:hypothetical protein